MFSLSSLGDPQSYYSFGFIKFVAIHINGYILIFSFLSNFVIEVIGSIPRTSEKSYSPMYFLYDAIRSAYFDLGCRWANPQYMKQSSLH